METIKLQDKLQEMQNEVCLRITGVYWSQLLITFADGKITHQQVRDVQREVSIAFASYCCERQRESDSKAATWDAPLESLLLNQNGDYVVKQTDISVDKDSILNNPLITDEL